MITKLGGPVPVKKWRYAGQPLAEQHGWPEALDLAPLSQQWNPGQPVALGRCR